MNSATVPIVLSQYIPPLVCFGMLLMGALIFAYIFIRFRDLQYLNMMLMALTGMVFVLCEALILVIGGMMRNPLLGMQFHRMEQIAAAFFIFLIPFQLYNFLQLTPRWKGFHRTLSIAGLTVALGFIVVALLQPDLYVSVTVHRQDWLLREADHGRGMQGPLYMVRDAVLFLLIIYAVVCYSVDMAMHRELRYALFTFIGLFLVIYGAVIDMISSYTTDSNLAYTVDPFPESRHSRFVIGITLFIILSMGGALRRFLDLARETERAKERERIESEKNRRQNNFIREVLQKHSDSIFGSTEHLSSDIAGFTDNSREQAAATEEIGASIEEVSAAVESVKASVDDQRAGTERLVSAMAELTAASGELDSTISGALSRINQVASNAVSGEESLKVMNESMVKIGASSGEITGIIGIINDISDRINLLSLNAAIEAARAGDAGRGFAVVADEISKLADQTAESIKNINSLIKKNEGEIDTGRGNITIAVERINLIMSDINAIVEMISGISSQSGRQSAASTTVNESAGIVKSGSQRISDAMREQSGAIMEISNTVNSISVFAQDNAQKITSITESSRALVGMVRELNREIEESQDLRGEDRP
ncbi:MAG: hypothetical protein JXA20_19690 [Spirochaetes bacterium]|nr:hypothetical protein [Spirochaetota bacterium]